MPHYTFALRDGSGAVEDRIGAHLAGALSARDYAMDVAHELMHGWEAQVRYWRLDVYDHEGKPVFQIPFASIDRSLDHLAPEQRRMMVESGERRRSLMEAVHVARATVLETRALVARSRGKPYLASFRGEHVIRAHKK